MIDIVLVNADKVTAVLEKLNMKIPYSALPADMIDTLEIDVDGMPVGTIVTVGDIPELKSEKLALQSTAMRSYSGSPTENAEEELLLRQRRLRRQNNCLAGAWEYGGQSPGQRRKPSGN